MSFVLLLGRVLYTAVFLVSVPGLFTDETIRYAASQGVPMAGLLVPLSGIIAFLGGVCVLIGFRAKEGAWLLVLFLVPVTLMLHSFWGIANPAAAAMQQVQFMKNLGLIGAAFLIAYFGSGPFSLDNWLKRRTRERQGIKTIDLTSKRGR